MTNPPVILDITKAAIRLSDVLRAIRTVQADENAREPDTVTIYAVDADIVNMFMSPTKNANYGALLRFQQSARTANETDNWLYGMEQRTVEFLSAFLLFELQNEQPMILLHSHADDLQRVLNQVFIKSRRQQEDIETLIDRLAIEQQQIAEEKIETARTTVITKGKEDNKAKHISDVLDKIRDCFKEGPVSELYRAHALSENSNTPRILHIDRFPFVDAGGFQKYMPVPVSESGTHYLATYKRLSDRVFIKLKSKAKIIGNKALTLRRDADAIGQLAWINDLLVKDKFYVNTDSGLKRVGQVKLISGSFLIPIAIELLELSKLKHLVRGPLGYLGHGKLGPYFGNNEYGAESDNSSVSNGSENEGFPLPETPEAFADFLAELRDSFSKSSEKLDQQSKAEKATQALGKLIPSWRDKQVIENPERFRGLQLAVSQLENNGHSLDGLRSFVAKWAADTFTNFARLSTLMSLRAGDEISITRRNIPPVRFLNFQETRKISRQLYLFGDNALSRKHAEDIITKRNIEALKKDDPTSYTEFVCYGLWALVMRNLQLASGCLNYALTLIPKNNENNPFIKGDEALYLLAHTTRLQAKSIANIHQAKLYLKISERLYNEAPSPDTKTTAARDVRFIGEEFSLECHGLYFRIWNVQSKEQLQPAPPVEIKEIASQLDKGVLLLAELQNESCSDDLYVTEYVKQQLLVNSVQLGLILSFGSTPRLDLGEGLLEIFPRSSERSINDDRMNDVRELAQALAEHCEMLQIDQREELPDASILATTVSAVGRAALLGDSSSKLPIRTDKNWIFSPIDHHRFEYLEKVWLRTQK
jgi:hypothetical protein